MEDWEEELDAEGERICREAWSDAARAAAAAGRTGRGKGLKTRATAARRAFVKTSAKTPEGAERGIASTDKSMRKTYSRMVRKLDTAITSGRDTTKAKRSSLLKRSMQKKGLRNSILRKTGRNPNSTTWAKTR